ncbi:WG repeat-containing protein [Ferruginibacter albus]|uniref:WG repeat-containing protein n=1 Tax=Ferruginibacter albus TaxID=2875540 RepID=UPI001CC78A2B|nr:WG repeat-containing protein [Ferruginibacter albus]UAY53179.1 WG repeat-containing protein [Ferruginibacter albus]
MKQLFLALLSTLILMAGLSAQIKQTNKNIDRAIETASTIADIFKAKKKIRNDVDSIKNVISTNAKLKPGDLSPNAVVLDVDRMYNFNHGAAVVQKGNKYAMMDTTGNTVIGFGNTVILSKSPQFLYERKFTNKLTSYSGEMSTGLFSGDGFINYKGEIIGSSFIKKGFIINGLSYDGKYVSFYLNKKYVYVDVDQNSYSVEENLKNLSENIGITVKRSANGKELYGYRNLGNKAITDKIYDVAEPFFDGMACVGKKDFYGEVKYGFIDTTGKEVIPCQYTNEPMNFSCGFAKVVPKDKGEYKSCYINKKGDVVFKIKDKDFDMFLRGYAFNGTSVMDTLGKIYTHTQFLEKWGIKSDLLILDYKYAFNDGKIRVRGKSKQEPAQQAFGYIDLRTNKFVEPYFRDWGASAGNAPYFDPVAKLAYVEYYLGKDAAGKEKYRKGYINEDGIFMIVMAEKSAW